MFLSAAFLSVIMAGNGGYKESELVNLAARGNNAAIKVIYDTYVGYLSAVCARYIVDEDDRKDVLQECFIRIFTSLDKFDYRGEGSLKAWMIRIVVNESLRFLKKARLTISLGMRRRCLTSLTNLKLREYPMMSLTT